MFRTTSKSFRLRLPFVLTKFCEPVPLDGGSYFGAWKAINGPPLELQSVLKSSRVPDPKWCASLFAGMRVSTLSGIDPSPGRLVTIIYPFSLMVWSPSCYVLCFALCS